MSLEEIRRLVNEIALLSRSDVSPQDYYEQFLNRVVQLLAAVGGAVWMLDDNGALELQYQINIQQTRLAEDVEDQQRHARLLHQVMFSGEGRAVPPNDSLVDGDDEANTTDFLLLLSPLHSGDEVRGIVEIFQQPVGQFGARQRLKFLGRMCELASDYYLDRNFPFGS